MGRLKNDKQGTRLTVTLEADHYAKICLLANQNDVSAAWIIRRAVENYLAPADAAPKAGKPALKQGGARS